MDEDDNGKFRLERVKDQSGPPWIDRHLHKVKYTAWSRAKQANKNGDWSTFKKYRNKLENNIKTKHKVLMTGISDAVRKKPKRFWCYFK